MEPNNGGAGILGAGPAAGRSRLNSAAPAFDPRVNRAPEEDRCCFLTFSNGYPIVEPRVTDFFNEIFGPNCVERVYIHRPVGQPSLFGKVVFRSLLTPTLVLEGQDVKKYMVDGYPMWCKKYDKEKAQQGRQL
ncbi:hypothetical protein M0R45_035009 [Rubus argutus]|uniref:Uncharacterized protein n=1 Tax=Rubus argutus TaxID=59490 RepID=A0AAW1VSX2_RUBAR